VSQEEIWVATGDAGGVLAKLVICQAAIATGVLRDLQNGTGENYSPRAWRAISKIQKPDSRFKRYRIEFGE